MSPLVPYVEIAKHAQQRAMERRLAAVSAELQRVLDDLQRVLEEIDALAKDPR